MSENFITFNRLGTLGRLGNQMFQIAVVIGACKLQNKIPIFPKWYCSYSHLTYSNYFKKKINESLDARKIEALYREPCFNYVPIINCQHNLDIIGYFQSEQYFLHCIEDIRAYFEPEDIIIQQLQAKFATELQGLTCSLHIRRGDYIGNKEHEVCNITYYERCLEAINPICQKFLVFSDDIAWCKQHLARHHNLHFIEGNNPIEDMFLMSLCQHNIIANSSFSWWASWLNKNPNKIVYAPKQWFPETAHIKSYTTIYRPDMIII